MARILSIDYGKKRTGLAVTDPAQIIAGGLVTVATSELFSFLTDYIKKEPVERIVIGEPKQPDGRPSENMARVVQFVNRWRKAYPEIPIEFYDERFYFRAGSQGDELTAVCIKKHGRTRRLSTR